MFAGESLARQVMFIPSRVPSRISNSRQNEQIPYHGEEKVILVSSLLETIAKKISLPKSCLALSDQFSPNLRLGKKIAIGIFLPFLRSTDWTSAVPPPEAWPVCRRPRTEAECCPASGSGANGPDPNGPERSCSSRPRTPAIWPTRPRA